MFAYLAVLAIVPPAGANPYAADVAAVLADAKKLDLLTASFTRYMSLTYGAATREAVNDRRVLIDLWVNVLSRRKQLARARRVGVGYVAVDIRAYGWDAETWEALAFEDPYYHVQVKVTKGQTGQKRYFRGTGSDRGGMYAVDVKADTTIPAFAPWVPAGDALELATRCNSGAPIVRADWWFSRASQQENRKGTGYYDWLGLKDQKDYDDLLGFNRKESDKRDLAVAAIVRRSKVSRFPRQVFVERALTGDRYETRDVITDNQNERNALRNLDADYKHEVVELYGHLPNDLFALFLADAKGVRQDSAPDGVGFHHGVSGNDGKIHIGVACYACHAEGLRPVEDWGRQVFRGGLQLGSADYTKLDRLQRLYLGDDFFERLDDGNARYARALNRLTGLKPPEAAKLVLAGWEGYVDSDILPKQAADEFGVMEADYLKTLRGYFKANPLSDQVLASHIADPPIPLRRDDLEQIYPILAQVILGPKPSGQGK